MSQKNNDVELEHVIKLRLIIRTRRGGAGGGMPYGESGVEFLRTILIFTPPPPNIDISPPPFCITFTS